LPLSNISAFKAGIKPDATAYRDMGLEITYNKEIQYIRLDWRGFQSLHTIKAGCYELVDVLQKYKCHMALNINTNVIGSWEDAAEWVGKDCFPMLERAQHLHVGGYKETTLTPPFTVDDHATALSDASLETLRACISLGNIRTVCLEHDGDHSVQILLSEIRAIRDACRKHRSI
ncbi:MAG: DUF692 family protein, partial [Alcaligenaceae bacterium]